jgi:2'-5' RNA ligase
VYLFAAPEKNREKIIGKCTDYAKALKPIPVTAKGLSSNNSGLVMIDIELTPEVFDIHKKALEMFNPLRDGYQRDKYDDPEELGKLAPDDLKHVQDYGYIFILNKFAPHITIARIKDRVVKQETVAKYDDLFEGKTSTLSRLQIHEAIFGENDRTELLCDIPLGS